MADIATLSELRALRTSISSGDPVERDLATSVAVGQLLDDLIARREAASGIAYGTSGGALNTSPTTDVETLRAAADLADGRDPGSPVAEALRNLADRAEEEFITTRDEASIRSGVEIAGQILSAPVARPIDTSGMTGDGGKVSWPTA